MHEFFGRYGSVAQCAVELAQTEGPRLLRFHGHAPSLRRASLARRIRGGERLNFLALGHDALGRRDVVEVDLEHAHHCEYAGQADVGQRRLVAVAEAAGAGLTGQALLDGAKPGAEPLDLPGAPLIRLATMRDQLGEPLFDVNFAPLPA